ncbi:MAG: hypothetical protein RR518_11035, partial [Coprobacillus sp.]
MKKVSKLTISLVAICMIAVTIGYSVNAKETQVNDGSVATETLNEDNYFSTMDENGNITEVSEKELNKSGIVYSSKVKGRS